LRVDRASFQDLIRRVRSRDEAAATELVRRYEPAIRTVIRAQLTDKSLRRLFDSMDICQSVLANFFVRAALGEFELDEPEDLLALLTTMARNRLQDYISKQKAARRDYRRQEKGAPDEAEVVDPRPGTSEVVANQELLAKVYERLSPEERHLAEERALGRSWEALASELGAKPDSLRKRLSRALDRVAAEFAI
jgi:RNA polymerase sigma-70 factor (ECF subfamily)